MLQTNPDDFQRRLFAANLGHHTECVIGNGLVAGAFVGRSAAHAMLRVGREHGSSVNVEFHSVRGRGISTTVHGWQTVLAAAPVAVPVDASGKCSSCPRGQEKQA